MIIDEPNFEVSDFPSAKAVRRFWIAWLVFLLTLLAGFLIVILIAAVAADPAQHFAGWVILLGCSAVSGGNWAAGPVALVADDERGGEPLHHHWRTQAHD